ncbi:hypothetical protein F6S08_21590 [Pseudomonas sp. JV449]|nr:hypothetical protein [Pseudomonas sp. JV449]
MQHHQGCLRRANAKGPVHHFIGWHLHLHIRQQKRKRGWTVRNQQAEL